MNDNAHYDPMSATLTIDSDGFDELSRALADSEGHTGNSPRSANRASQWVTADGLADGRVPPTVIGIVEVLARPSRSIVVERFCDGIMLPLFIAWDSKGRSTLTEGTTDGQLSIRATSIDLLPSLLLQALHLHRGMTAISERGPIPTTAGALDAAFTGATPELVTSAWPAPALAAVTTALTFAWRASGSWPDAETDTSLTAFSAGPEGLWIVDRSVDLGAGPGDSADDDRPVLIVPTTATELAARLGDVVTGRVSPRPGPPPIPCPA